MPSPIQTRRVMSLAPIAATTDTPWTPMALNPLIWLDAKQALANGQIDGETVDACTDFSGNGNDFVQDAASKRPVMDAVGINEQAAYRFDGVDDIVRSDALTAAASFWSFIVLAPANNDITTSPISFKSYADAGGAHSILWKGTETELGWIQGGYPNLTYVPLTTGTRAILCRGTPNSGELKTDNKDVIQDTNPHQAGGTPMDIGGVQGLGWHWNGWLSEFLYAAGPLSPADEGLLWNYAHLKWGTKLP